MTGLASDDLARELRRTGYCIVPDLIPPDAIAALDADLDPVFAATPFGRGDFYGHRTKRFGALMKRSAWAQALALEHTILAAVESILGEACERIQLNVEQAIEIHPGEHRQFPTSDHAMWVGEKGAPEITDNG